MDGFAFLITSAIVLAVIVGLFILFRALILWYYRINEKIENQHRLIKQNNKIISLLENINDNIQNSIIDQKEHHKELIGSLKRTKKDGTNPEVRQD